MLAHIGQGFLHYVQHVHLDVRVQRDAVAFHLQFGREAVSVAELGQRGYQGGLDVLGVGARAKVHQQFPHIGVALAYAGVQFGDRAIACFGVAVAHSVTQQLHLDLQEGQ